MDPITIAMMAAGIGQTVSGLLTKVDKNLVNQRPEYAPQQGIVENQQIAESMAGRGMSDAAKQTSMNMLNRGLTSSVDAILRGGGSVNNIGDLYDSFSSGVGRMSLAEDEARFRNLNLFLRANEQMAQETEKAWQINEYAPWADKMQLNAAKAEAKNKNIWGGINTAISAYGLGKMGDTNKKAGLFQTKASNKTIMPGMSPTATPLSMGQEQALNMFGLSDLISDSKLADALFMMGSNGLGG